MPSLGLLRLQGDLSRTATLFCSSKLTAYYAPLNYEVCSATEAVLAF